LNRFGGAMHWIVTHARFVSWAGILLTIALSGVALTLRPDAKTTENLPDHSAAAQTLAHCDRTMGGIDFVRVVVNWPASMSGDDPAIMRAVERVHEILDEEPLLRHPVSIRSIATTLAPDDANIREQMSVLQLIPPPLLDLLYNAEASRALVTVRLQDLGIAKYRPVFRRLLADLENLKTEFPGFAFEITGEPVVEGRELTQIVYDLAASLGTASVIIFFVMMIAYRSIRIGLISVVPNVLPLAVTAASLVFLGKSLTVTSVCAFTVCIGIAVDDTIHFLTRFLHECQDRGETRKAIEDTFHAVGAAMVTTTLVLVTGFGAVLFSELPTHRTFATMAVCTIVAALLADLVLLPAILAYFYPQRQEKLVDENPAS
jgi:predicted RND superfamily exporter protein